MRTGIREGLTAKEARDIKPLVELAGADPLRPRRGKALQLPGRRRARPRDGDPTAESRSTEAAIFWAAPTGVGPGTWGEERAEPDPLRRHGGGREVTQAS